MDTNHLVEPRRRPRMVYLGSVWSAIRAVYGIFVLIGWARLIDTYGYGDQVSNYIGAWFFIMIIQILAFALISIAIFSGWNWGRLGFLLVSILIFAWALFRQPLGVETIRAVYSLIAIFIGSWLFNQTDVLEYFVTGDIRPRWLTRRFFGIQLDLVIGLVLLGVVATIEAIGALRWAIFTF